MKMDGKLGSPEVGKSGSWSARGLRLPEFMDVVYRFTPKYTLLIGCERF